MRIFKGAVVFLMVVAMVVTAGQMASASRTGTQAPGDAPPITVDPSFKGTIVDTRVGLVYEKDGDPASCSEALGPAVKMTVIMSLQLGKNTLVPFGSAAFNLCYWNFAQQDAALHEVLRTQVMPFLFSIGFTEVPDPCFAIKSVESAVDDIDGDFCNPAKPTFSLLELGIAIDTDTSCPAP